jgi:hypothetical protein
MTTINDTDAENFASAVENDEYAELELETGDVLVTDWEGNGVFNPYVVVRDGGVTDVEAAKDQIAAAIQDRLGVRVSHLHYAEGANPALFLVQMRRPEV